MENEWFALKIQACRGHFFKDIQQIMLGILFVFDYFLERTCLIFNKILII